MFDLPLVFEQTVLQSIPAVLFIVLAAVRVLVLWRRQPVCRTSWILGLQLVCAVSLCFA